MKIDYGNLPTLMTSLDQWVCYDIENDRKIPYTPGTDDKARSNDPTTWRTFAEAAACVKSGERMHLGFMMLRENGLVFLDLDHTSDPGERRKNKLIYQSFPSYSELSVSGKGIHIILKGNLEGRGLHTSHFGAFDHARGILVTGHVLDGRRKIKRGNEKMLKSLQESVRSSSGRGYDFELEEDEWDADPVFVLYLASIIYGDKFHSLYRGAWQGLGYPSQSEADHALINMFCDICQSNPLVRYLFAESGLYREHKARRDPCTGEYSVKGYLDYTIKQNREKRAKRDASRERIKNTVDREAKKSAKKKKKKSAPKSRKDLSDKVLSTKFSKTRFDYPTDLIDKIPSKLVKETAHYLYRNSYRPNQEISIFAAMLPITAKVQRAYLTPTGTGCNMNWWLIAQTGWGKETFTKAFNMIAGEMINEYPQFGHDHVGKFASGEAVETVIADKPRFLSRVAEAGAYWRKLLTTPRPPHIDVLAEAKLNLFMSTSPGEYWKSRKKAKKDEDIAESIFRPAGSFYGESTPEDLLGDLDLSAIETGLLQRQVFYSIDEASYVKANKSRSPMKSSLKSMFRELATTADNLDLVNETMTCAITERAEALLDEYNEELSAYAFKKEKNTLRANLMNRSGIKAYRMATILAVGDDMENPVIKEAHAQYAIEFIRNCDEFILDKFMSGDIGKGQLKQENDMMTIIKWVTGASATKRRRSMKMNELCSEDNTIIPYSLLKQHAKKRVSFAKDRLGAVTAIDKCIESLCRSGTLVRLSRADSEEEYDTAAGLLRYTAL